ncbi:hypothetical protein NPIL_431121 [Nephila pilipes]|uniref:Uncharacterized protein n=1 Tax=Nephila pilipes TaxID=299642 RepID=A0A8X6JEP8_NEPPI|nr:hypothetical protein NPIL_431111 [Nephila pilipes]GFS64621.1 hypothetical protein NPIL_431121 [Nephila pilipes]
METLDSGKFSADQCRITFLPQVPGQIIDTENCKGNYLYEVNLVDVCGEGQLNFKWCETLEKKIISKKRKRCLKDNSSCSDKDNLINVSRNKQNIRSR